jgi:hypothetical protein
MTLGIRGYNNILHKKLLSLLVQQKVEHSQSQICNNSVKRNVKRCFLLK